MQYTSSPTEQTTAATDILLFLFAAAAIWYLQSTNLEDTWKVHIWSLVFGLISLASLLGAVYHGVILPEEIQQKIWQIVTLSLGLAISLFVVGVVYDLFGPSAARVSLPLLLLAAVGFYLVTQFFSGIFFVFIIFESGALLFALIGYTWLAVHTPHQGPVFMAAGVFVSILAAGIQAIKSVEIRLVWEFDHNGVFHLVQLAGIVLLVAGIRFS
jgi:hypothetical protein